MRSEFDVPINSDRLGSLKVKAKRFSLSGHNDTGPAPISIPTVQLVSMDKLTNVNAIVSDKPLEFRPRGLTIVFGYNGSGKTGYSRVLKRACYARDSHASNEGDAILPDRRIYGEGEQPASKTTAKFMLKVDGNEQPIHWNGEKRIAEHLDLPNSPIAVFDSSAADVYIIGDNEVPFRPYGLDIMVELTKVCDTLQEFVSQDMRFARQKLQKLWDSPWKVSTIPSEVFTSTKTKKFISKIKNPKLNLTESDINTAREISKSFCIKKRNRLKYLNGIFKEQDPVKSAKLLRNEMGQIIRWKNEIAGIAKSIVSDIPCRLRESINEFQEANKFAHGKMDELPVRISKSGSSLWNDLFTAAENFTQEIDPDGEFPNVKECVLCQQPMPAENKKMLSTLKKFVREGAGKVRDDKKTEVGDIIRSLEGISPKHPLNEFLIQAIERIAIKIALNDGGNFSALNQEIEDFIDALVEARKDLLGMAKNALTEAQKNPLGVAKCFEWQSSLQLQQNSPIEKIEEFCRSAETMAVDLENSGELRPEYDNLESMDLFAQHLDNIINYINLRRCFQDTDSTKISNKTRELSQTPLNDQLTHALKSEIKALGMFDEEKFLTKSHQTKAKQKASIRFKVKDDSPISGTTLTKILSEGELRTIALASFFAEISLSPKSVSSIIFDDPVSSLDHVRVGYFADRLRKEAAARQVIVFTHDLYFSNLFNEKEAFKIAVWKNTKISGFGLVDEMPYDGGTIKSQIAQLRDKARKIKDYDSPEQENEIRHGYEYLREAVEHLTERCLLQNMVSRRTIDIKVSCASKVFSHCGIKEEIANKAEELWDRASKANPRHRKPSERAGNPVDIDQFVKDIETLNNLREKLANCGSSD